MEKPTRVVLVTGSSRGIGEAIAAQFLGAGDQVAIFCRHREHVKQAKLRLAEVAPEKNILTLVGDVREPKDVTKIVSAVVKKFGRLDVLVNNAGIGLWKLIEDTTLQEYNDVMDTNMRGYFLFAQKAMPLMKEQGSGVIINVSSGLGVRGDAKYSAYSPF